MGSKHHEELDYSKKCACGKGTIDYYTLTIEKDFPPFEVEQKRIRVNCTNPCCPSRGLVPKMRIYNVKPIFVF